MTSRFVLVVLVALVTITLFPHAAAASEQNTRLVFEIKTLQNISLADLAPVLVKKSDQPQQPEVVEPQVDPNIAILQSYLEKKGSPLAPYAESILQNENWKLVLAISNGESTLCKKQRDYNCWGIGGAWNLKKYASFEEAFTDVNRIVTTKYVANGLDTPEKMVNRYVGHPNSSWVYAVNQILNQVNDLPLTN